MGDLTVAQLAGRRHRIATTMMVDGMMKHEVWKKYFVMARVNAARCSGLLSHLLSIIELVSTACLQER